MVAKDAHMKFTLGFSPCPNDTFIFDALVNKLIDTEGIDFEVFLEDVQTLNEWALAGKLDFSKISYGVLPLVTDQYLLLPAGGALGKGVGPLLISNGPATKPVDQMHIAIPGKNTTAHLLFSLAYPGAMHKSFMAFNEIEEAVLSGQVDAGVIIHENRFTYRQKGLHKLVDLGQYWETTTASPIPLGGIVAHKRIGFALAGKVNDLIRKSLQHAFTGYPQVSAYVQQHAQEMSADVMKQHIDLYVNDFSLKLGNEGMQAVYKLLEVYRQMNPTDTKKELQFITDF